MFEPSNRRPHLLRHCSRLYVLLSLAMGMAGGCSEADTVVSVDVEGTIAGVQQLRATLTVADRIRTFRIPDRPRAITLPTSFTVQIDRSVQGQLEVTVDALNAGETLIARGTACLSSLVIGKNNSIQVILLPGSVGLVPTCAGADGGIDDASDAFSDDLSGSGGTGGEGGTTGSGGGVGTGGMGTGGAGTGGGGRGGAGTGGVGTGGMGTGGTGTGGGGRGGAGAGGAGTGGAGTGGAGTGGAGTGGAGTGGAGTGGAGTGGAGTGGAGTGGAGTGGAGTGGAGTGGAGTGGAAGMGQGGMGGQAGGSGSGSGGAGGS